MNHDKAKGQRHENKLSSLPSDTRNDTDLRSNEQSRNVAEEQSQSASALSTPRSTVSNARDLLPQGLATKSLRNGAEQGENITVSQARDCLLSKTSKNTKVVCSPGNPPKLDFSSGVWVVRNIAQVVAYVLPSDEAEEWFGALLELNHELLKAGVPRWKINGIALLRIVQLVWAAHKVDWSDFIKTDWDKRK